MLKIDFLAFRKKHSLKLCLGVLLSLMSFSAIASAEQSPEFKPFEDSVFSEKQYNTLALNQNSRISKAVSTLSYNRGGGSIPNSCKKKESFSAGLCYKRCKKGYRGAATVCAKPCPKGYRNDGLFCLKPKAKKRGAGYPWKVGDPLGSLDKARKRCKKSKKAKRWGKGCEKYGQIIYPKCPKGYKRAGCCLCTPTCKGMAGDIGVSCSKKTYDRGPGKVAKSCGRGKENSAGLCYPKCKRGYIGVGPVCWRKIDNAKIARLTSLLKKRANKPLHKYRDTIKVISNHFHSLLRSRPNYIKRAEAARKRGDHKAVANIIRLPRLLSKIKKSVGSLNYISRSVASTAKVSLDDDAVFRSVSFSPIIADGSVIVGGTWESGIVWKTNYDGKNHHPFSGYAYTSSNITTGISAGLDYSMGFGLWVAEPKNIGGSAHGFTIAASYIGGASISFWWENKDGANVGEDFLGLSFSPSLGVSLEGEYTWGETEVR